MTAAWKLSISPNAGPGRENVPCPVSRGSRL